MGKDEFDKEQETAEVEALYGHRLKTVEYSSGEELTRKAKERFIERKDQLKDLLQD